MIKPDVILEDIKAILTAVPFTLGAALAILIAAIILGLFLAVIRIKEIPVAKTIVHAFIHYVRGIPLIIHLYIAYYALPQLIRAIYGWFGYVNAPEVSPMAVLLVAYSLYASVGQAENIRGAFYSVDPGQWDASYSVGFTYWQSMRRVILPQGLAVAIPVFFNSYLNIIKGLSLAFTIGVMDILARAKLCSAQNYSYLEAYISAALVYWALCILLGFVFRKTETTLTKW